MPIITLAIIAYALFLVQNISYKKLWKKGLSYTVRFSSKENFENDTVYIKEELVNKKFLPLPWVHVKTTIPNGLMATDANNVAGSSLFSIGKYMAKRKKTCVVCKNRGVYRLRYSQIVVSDLLHATHFSDEFNQSNDEMVVFPRFIEDSHELNVLFKMLDSAVISNQLINPDPFEFRGLRDYQPTDTLKSVNFKASAIAQKLMVNVHAPTSAKRITFVLNLDSEGRDGLDVELYEQSIRLVATLVQHFIKQDALVGFITNGCDASTLNPMKVSAGTSQPHLFKILGCLARISLNFNYHGIKPFAEENQVYVFISPSKKITPTVQEMQKRGVDVLLIVPYFTDGSGEYAWECSKL